MVHYVYVYCSDNWNINQMLTIHDSISIEHLRINNYLLLYVDHGYIDRYVLQIKFTLLTIKVQ